MAVLKFNSENISDQKRVARGEHLLQARSCLRARDEIHHRRWSILMLAGGSPAGEIGAIRALMPKAHIVAVDNAQPCIEAAIDAGADDVVLCDLTDFDESMSKRCGISGLQPSSALDPNQQYDIVDLDLCGGANGTTRDLFNCYKKTLTPGGVVLLTFSYGRDVAEMYKAVMDDWRFKSKHAQTESQQERYLRVLDRFSQVVPENVLGRICYLFSPSQMERIRSVILYRGSEMPMCSVLYQGGSSRVDKLSFVQLETGDFELAVVYPDVSALYDCPQSRIEALRRKFAAIKAVLTKKEKLDLLA